MVVVTAVVRVTTLNVAIFKCIFMGLLVVLLLVRGLLWWWW